MTPRRGFLIALALATLPIAGQAQARLARIGFLANSVPLRELIGRVRSIPYRARISYTVPGPSHEFLVESGSMDGGMMKTLGPWKPGRTKSCMVNTAPS